jgi:glycosyltransferase involved in cell wall biosynthesis
MFPILAQCDIGAISYQEKMGKECMPNRVFEYIAVGLPAIVPNYAVEMRNIIETYKCGICANMEDVLDIAEKISELILNPDKTRIMAMNSKNAYLDGCNWEEESRNLIKWIKEA